MAGQKVQYKVDHTRADTKNGFDAKSELKSIMSWIAGVNP